MKDEIKLIITEMQLRNGRYIIYKNEDISFSDEDYKAHLLLDYITNLQDRIRELEQINEEHRKINGELHEELDKYKNIVDEIQTELFDIKDMIYKPETREENIPIQRKISEVIKKLEELKGSDS